jgi:hypothetical protein
MTFHPIASEFPDKLGKFCFLFISALGEESFIYFFIIVFMSNICQYMNDV